MDTAARIDGLAERGYDDELIGLLLGVERADVAAFRFGREPGSISSGGGSGSQVFVEEDLVIPAGTDWSHQGHALGQIKPQNWGELWFFKLYLEVEAPLSGSDQLILDLSNDPDWSVSGSLSIRLSGGDGKHWKQFGYPADGGNADFLLGQSANPSILNSGEDASVPPPPLETQYLGLHTDAAISTPITIVRAQGSFLVI
jgi:hypothetical protein